MENYCSLSYPKIKSNTPHQNDQMWFLWCKNSFKLGCSWDSDMDPAGGLTVFPHICSLD